jgi:hypothetical protein
MAIKKPTAITPETINLKAVFIGNLPSWLLEYSSRGEVPLQLLRLSKTV